MSTTKFTGKLIAVDMYNCSDAIIQNLNDAKDQFTIPGESAGTFHSKLGSVDLATSSFAKKKNKVNTLCSQSANKVM